MVVVDGICTNLIDGAIASNHDNNDTRSNSCCANNRTTTSIRNSSSSSSPQKSKALYGRQDALEALQQAYRRCCCCHRYDNKDDKHNASCCSCELVLISGEAGSGKTALARTLQTFVVQETKEVENEEGLFGSGKFDPPPTFITSLDQTNYNSNNGILTSRTDYNIIQHDCDGSNMIANCCTVIPPASMEEHPLMTALSQWMQQILQKIANSNDMETAGSISQQRISSSSSSPSLRQLLQQDIRKSILTQLKSEESHEFLRKVIPGLEAILPTGISSNNPNNIQGLVEEEGAVQHNSRVADTSATFSETYKTNTTHLGRGNHINTSILTTHNNQKDIKVIASKFILAVYTAVRGRFPLILFLDDLQWSDDLTLDVLQNVILAIRTMNDTNSKANHEDSRDIIITNDNRAVNSAATTTGQTAENVFKANNSFVSNQHHENQDCLSNSRSTPCCCLTLLIVGTYRNDQISSSHALSRMLRSLQQHPSSSSAPSSNGRDHNELTANNNGIVITTIPIHNLTEQSIQEMLTDAWKCIDDDVTTRKLAHEIHRQTKGNALFVQHAIKSLQVPRSNTEAETTIYDTTGTSMSKEDLRLSTSAAKNNNAGASDLHRDYHRHYEGGDQDDCQNNWESKLDGKAVDNDDDNRTSTTELMEQHYKSGGDDDNDNDDESTAVITDFVTSSANRMKQYGPCIHDQLKLAACLGKQFPMDVWQAVMTIRIASPSASSLIDESQVTDDNDYRNDYRNDHVETFAPMICQDEQSSCTTKTATNYEALVKLGHLQQQDGDHHDLTLQWQHDLVWQAAYSLIPERERPTWHLSIGRRLLQALPPSRIEQSMFVILSQYSHGVPALTRNHHNRASSVEPNNENIRVANLCLRAGESAALASSFQTASSCLNLGIAVLADDTGWNKSEHDLCLALRDAAAEASFCIADFERMDQHLDSVLLHAKTYKESLRARTMQIYALGARGRHEEAYNQGVDALRHLGVLFPKSDFYIFDYIWTWRMLQGKKDRTLLSLPLMKDENKLAAMSILFVFIATCTNCRPQLLPFITTCTVRLTLKHGLCPASSLAFLFYGVSRLQFGKRRDGFRFGQLALRIVDMLNAKEFLPRSYMLMYTYINPWNRPLRDSLTPLEYGFRAGLETGDIDTAVKCRFQSCKLLLWSGKSLTEVQLATRKSHEVVIKYKQAGFEHVHKLMLQFCDNFMVKTNDPSILSGAVVSIEEANIMARRTNNHYMLVDLPVLGMWLAVYFNNYELALQMGAEGRAAIARGKIAYFVVCQHRFYEGVAALELSHRRREKRKQYLALARRNLNDLQLFEMDAPQNCQNKVLLLEALFAAHDGKRDVALALFERSVNLAIAEGFLHEQALACELAGVALRRFNYFSRATQYFIQARDLYQQWGAVVKTVHMTHRYKL